ncbi:hypothetical protein ACFQZC_32985 [Streptacidiphilus monticola]
MAIPGGSLVCSRTSLVCSRARTARTDGGIDCDEQSPGARPGPVGRGTAVVRHPDAVRGRGGVRRAVRRRRQRDQPLARRAQRVLRRALEGRRGAAAGRGRGPRPAPVRPRLVLQEARDPLRPRRGRGPAAHLLRHHRAEVPGVPGRLVRRHHGGAGHPHLRRLRLGGPVGTGQLPGLRLRAQARLRQRRHLRPRLRHRHGPGQSHPLRAPAHRRRPRLRPLRLRRGVAALRRGGHPRADPRLPGVPALHPGADGRTRRPAAAAAPRSLVFLGGGWKGHADRAIPKEDLYASVREQLGVPDDRIREAYGSVEHPLPYYECARHRLHTTTWGRMLVRAVDTLEPLPWGEPGYAHFVSPFITSMPAHSIVMNDLVSLRPAEDCGCGLPTPWFTVHGRAGVSRSRSCAVAASELIKAGI